MSDQVEIIKDAQGNEYKVDSEFTVGSFTILSGQGSRMAFRVSEDDLTSKSAIFRDMISALDDSLKQVSLPHFGQVIRWFLQVLRGNAMVGEDWRKKVVVLQFAELYDFPDVYNELFHAALYYVPHEDAFEAFAMASRKDDILAGAKVICQGWRLEALGEGGRYCALLRPTTWDKDEASMISATWLWALSRALENAQELFKESVKPFETEGFWYTAAGFFVEYIR